jgi:hypothetical protein
MIDSSDDDENADDSIRVNRESDSNEIDESDLQDEKHDEPRISTSRPSSIRDDVEKFRINLCDRISIKKSSHIRKRAFPSSITIDRMTTRSKADPSMDCTS